MGSIIHGLDLAPYAFLLNRCVVGLFFCISGFHKLFIPSRHAALVETLKAGGIPFVSFNEWWVPSVEFIGGAALILGCGAPLAALALGAICLVATCVDGVNRVRDFHPLNAADKVDDYLYLPECIYAVMLLTVILTGPGAFALT